MIDDPTIADEMVGFHLQQAAEKLMKAVLTASATAFRRTHDLVDLADVLSDAGFGLLAEVRGFDSLNPFTVEARYDFLPASSGPLDRVGMRQLLWALRLRAETVIHSSR